MRINIPEEVNFILHTLTTHGYEAYAVGGCVRDTILGRIPNDWDITTSAKPEEVKELFRRTVDTGIQHGTVTIMIHDTGYEVTTFRIDGKYSDNRHPESVTFTPNLEEDLKRRDFTINAMAYNEERGLVDLYGGQDDLESRIVRAVGEPRERFSEDALRIMRCIRFAAQLNFSIDRKTIAAAEELSENLKEISKERIREELLKILESSHPEYVALLENIGGMKTFYPEVTIHEGPRLMLLKKVPADRVMRLSALFYTEGQESAVIADRVLQDLKFDNLTRKQVISMLNFTAETLDADPVTMRKLLAKYGENSFHQLILFYETAKDCSLERERVTVQKIFLNGDCISMKTLAVTGQDLIKMGIKPGPHMGEIFEMLFEMVLQDPEMNQKELLLEKAVAL